MNDDIQPDPEIIAILDQVSAILNKLIERPYALVIVGDDTNHCISNCDGYLNGDLQMAEVFEDQAKELRQNCDKNN